jgi:hypothetical protein
MPRKLKFHIISGLIFPYSQKIGGNRSQNPCFPPNSGETTGIFRCFSLAFSSFRSAFPSNYTVRRAPFFASIFQNGLTARPACGTIPP